MNAWRTRRGCLSRRRFVRTRVLNEKSRFSARIGRDARDALYIAAWKLSFQLKRFREGIPMNLRFYASNSKHQLRSGEFMSQNIPRFKSFCTFYRTSCFRNERTRDSNLYKWKLSQTRFKRRPQHRRTFEFSQTLVSFRARVAWKEAAYVNHSRRAIKRWRKNFFISQQIAARRS